jgi:hypothetical protein
MAGNDLEPLVFQSPLPTRREKRTFSWTKDSGGGSAAKRWVVEPNTLRQFIAFWGN